MKVSYKFIDETVEIDVSEGWGSVLIELDRQEHNNNRRETRRHESYSGDNEKMETLEERGTDIEADFLCKADTERLAAALEKLLPQQRELVRKKVFFQETSITQIAREMGVSQQAISKQLKVIYKKLRKFIN